MSSTAYAPTTHGGNHPQSAHRVSTQTRSSSVVDLLAALVRLLPLQVKDELTLALSHVKSKGVSLGIAVALIVVGLALLGGMAISLVVALIGAFADPGFWFPALMVAAAFLVLALILMGIGAVMIKSAMPLIPAETVRNLEYDLGYLKEGNDFDPAEYDRVKAERAERKRLDAQREKERQEREKEENKQAKKRGEAIPHPEQDDASEAEVRRRAELRRRHLGDIRSGLDERASVKGQVAAFAAQRRGRGVTTESRGLTSVTAPYTGAARAGERTAEAEDFVKDRWQPLALLGAAGTTFAVLASRLRKK
ncbi:MAG: phage holin family protein [Micrococcus sp.]|nr:phage holin family protein [Micrococcus sp.]